MSSESERERERVGASSLADVPARLEHNRRFLKMLVAGFDEEAWFRAPADGLSNALWILGHLVWGRLVLLRRLGEELPEEAWESDFSIGSQAGGPQRIDAGELQDRFRSLGRLLADHLESLGEERLASPLEKPMPDGATTVAGLVRFMCFHESYHIGQLGLLRRLNGKSGLA